MTHIAHNWVPAPSDELVTDRGASLSADKGAARTKTNARPVFSAGLSRAVELAIALRHLGSTTPTSSASAYSPHETSEGRIIETHLNLAER